MALAIHAPGLPEADEASIVLLEVDDLALETSPETVAEALEGHIGDLGYRVRIVGTAEPVPGVPAEISIRIRTSTDDAWEVEFQRGDAPSWIRTLPADSDLDLRLEGLGVIVRGILVDAAATASDAPAQPSETPIEPPAEPVPDSVTAVSADPALAPNKDPISPQPRHQLRVWLAYRADSFGRSLRHGVAAGLGWQHVVGPTIQAELAWAPPQVSEALSIQRIPFQVGVGWRFLRNSRFQPAVFGGVTIEALGWSDAPSGTRAAPGWTTRAAMFVAVETAFDVSERVFAFARLSGRGWFQHASLLQRDADGDETSLLEPPRLSGAGLVGFGVRFAAGARRQPGSP